MRQPKMPPLAQIDYWLSILLMLKAILSWPTTIIAIPFHDLVYAFTAVATIQPIIAAWYRDFDVALSCTRQSVSDYRRSGIRILLETSSQSEQHTDCFSIYAARIFWWWQFEITGADVDGDIWYRAPLSLIYITWFNEVEAPPKLMPEGSYRHSASSCRNRIYLGRRLAFKAGTSMSCARGVHTPRLI